MEDAGLRVVVPRRADGNEHLDACLATLGNKCRKRVETTFSQLTEWVARSLHAVTPRRFELKVMLTVLTFTLLG